MSGSSKSFEDAERSAKKRRIYLIDDDVVLTESDIHLKQRLEIASKFGRETKIEDSEWFKKRGVRLSSVEVKKGVTILIPVDVPNVEEATDELWAKTSNWYYCLVEAVNLDATANIKIVGTMLPVLEDLLFETGWTAEICLNVKRKTEKN
jgi:hypothetical protein